MKECPRCPACFDDRFLECPEDGRPLESAFPGEPVIDGKYRIESRLGRGGMGVVYRARHLGLDRCFALKLIRFAYAPALGGRSFADRFAIEARALGQLRHPHVVQVTDYGIDPRGLPYLVMEHLEGPTLWELIHTGPRLSLDATLDVLEGVAEAIDHGHDHGILHRDIKPANVMVTEQGAKVLDFGLARLRYEATPEADSATMPAASVAAGPATEPGGLPGTPPYLAPELREGQPPTRACDVFSFGVLAYEALSGALPLFGQAGRSVHAPPLPPSRVNASIPPEIDAPVMAALEHEPSRRPARAGLAAAAMRTAHDRARRRQWTSREIPRRLRLTALLAPALAALAVTAGGGSVMGGLERRTVDARLTSQPRRAPDPWLVIVTVDEASLAADPTPLPDRADEFGRVLEEAFRAGARGVAIDLLLPERWSHSREFSQLVLRRRPALTLAAFVSPSGESVGTECVGGLTAATLGPDLTRELFGLANVDEDADGVTRQARAFYPDEEGGRRDSWVMRAARTLDGTADRRPAAQGSGRFWIDPAVDWARVPRVSWKDLPREIEQHPEAFPGRLLLVGGDFIASGDDYHRVAGGIPGPQAVSGIVLHALAVDTLLHTRPVRDVPWTVGLAATVLLSLVVMAATLCLRRGALLAASFLAANALYFLVPFWAFGRGRWLLPVATPVLGGLLSLAAGLLVRLRLPLFPKSESEMVSRSRAARIAAVVALSMVFCVPARAEKARGQDGRGDDVAVVSSLAGQATVSGPPAFRPRPAVVFDWLAAGSVIEVETGSELSLAFANGRRWRLDGAARAVLGANGPRLLSGTLRPLASVPPFPRLPAIAGDAQPGARSAAVRIRAGGEREIGGLYPRQGAGSPAAATVLRFDGVDGVREYHVEIEGDDGATVFEADVPAPEMPVPPEVLKPGARYRWRVQGTDRIGVTSEAETEFVTLRAEDARRRALLKAALEARSEPELLALSAEIDRRLGLWRADASQR